jgi:hypothetical protein
VRPRRTRRRRVDAETDVEPAAGKVKNRTLANLSSWRWRR